MAALFKKLAIHYGNLWTSQLPTAKHTEDAMREWGEYLADIKPADLKRGMDRLPDKPPSLPQFRNLCLGDNQGLSHNTAAYRRPEKALPAPKVDAKRAAEEIAKMRRCLKR